MANSPRPIANGTAEAAAVDHAADDDDADQRAEEERREDPAVELEVAELAGDDRHDRRDRERLEGDQRDGQDEPERQRAAVRPPQAVGLVLGRGQVHPARMAENDAAAPCSAAPRSTQPGRHSPSDARSRSTAAA